MKIGVDAQRLFRPKKHGMEIVSLEILRSLQTTHTNNQYEVFVKKDEDDACLQTSEPLRVHTTAALPYPIWEQLYLPYLAKKNKVQLLHCCANTAPLFCPVPLVVTIHDLIYMDDVAFKGSAYQNVGNVYRRWIVPTVAKNAAAIITVSAYAKEQISKRLKIPAHKIFVVHNGVNEKYQLITAESILQPFRDKHQLPAQFFLHFANEAPRKNTIGTLKAFAQYCIGNQQPLKLVLTNMTSTKLQQLLHSIAASACLPYIICMNYVPANELPILYNAATIFLYPSYSEGFGLPVVEAMACGTAVITANNSSLPEVAGDAAMLINASNDAALCEAMLTLSADENKRNDFIKKGLEQARKFSWSDAAKKTTEVYSTVLKG